VSSTHRIKVLGREVQVRSTATPEQVREIETYVNRTISEVQDSMKTGDSQLITILAMLNLAESYLLKSWENSRINDTFGERVSRLIRHIDETVKVRQL
jgi:cell division protein ZapA